MALNIYLVYRTDKASYDETEAAVIVAEDEGAARQLAKKTRGDQSPLSWDLAETTYLGVAAGDWATETSIILTEFNAG